MAGGRGGRGRTHREGPPYPWARWLRGTALGVVLVSSLVAGIASAVLGGLAVPAAPAAGARGAGYVAEIAGTPSVGIPAPGVGFAATPALTVYPTSGYPGENVTFNASGFAKSTAITITWSYKNSKNATVSVPACGPAPNQTGSGETSSTGTYQCTFLIPQHAAGTLPFVATTKAASAATSLAVVPHLKLSPTSGSVGSTLNFKAVGFSENGTGAPVPTGKKAATGYVHWSQGVACSATVTALGQFNCSYVLPDTFEGSHLFYTSDNVSTDNVTATFSVTPRLTAGPAFGPVGTQLTLTGTGFGSSLAVAVNWVGNASSLGKACATNSSGFGRFSCTFTIPVGTTGGTYTFTGTDSASNEASTVFSVTYLTITPSTATVGTIVTFQGYGYTPNSAFTLSWGYGTICPGSTNATGYFTCKFTVPPTPVGVHEFTGADESNLAASANLTIVPSAGVTPGGGMPNTTAHFFGYGYAAGSLVQVTWSGGKACNSTSAANGSFACAFMIPSGTPGGTYVFNASDALHDTAATEFVVTYLQANPISGPVGTTIQFTAGGFAASSPFKTTWTAGNVTSCTGTTTSKGTFTCAFGVPSTTVGPHVFTATDNAGDTARATFTVTPRVAINVSTADVGSALQFTGTGFAGSSSLRFTWLGGTFCSGTTSVTGQFSCNATMPSTPSGGYVITATDGANDSASTTLTIDTLLRASPNAGPVGTHVRFNATGFSSHASITISWAGGTVCATTTNATGFVTCNYTIPSIPPGQKTFDAVDSSSRNATVTFTVSPFVNATPAAGPIGTPITFRGEGFVADGVVNVTWSNGFACSGATDSTGRFTCSFTITPAPVGNHTFTATDSANPAHAASTRFAVVPNLALNVTTGRIGTAITLTATGFMASTTIQVAWSKGGICNGTTSVTGSFSCTFVIPAGTSGGPAVFTATDARRDNASATFLVTPVLAVSPASGPVGSTVTFNGTGFAPSAPANVTFAGGTVCNTTTTSIGAFSCAFTLPPLPEGPVTFEGSSAGANSTVVFTVVPAVTLTPSFGPPGTKILIQGTGFTANSSTKVVAAPTLGAICTNLSIADGNFTCTYTVPIGTAGGNYTFTATDSANFNASALFVVSFLHAVPATGTVGTVITLSGAGFNPGISFIITWLGGTACSGTTTVNGTIAACTYRLPPTPEGQYTFTGRDHTGLNASTIVTVEPSASAAPTSGPVGTVIDLSGTGYAANSTISGSGIGAATCASASNSVGNFTSCKLTVPTGTAAGTYTITVKDAVGNSATVKFTVTPTLTVSPTGGPAGTVVTFNGSGYEASSPITVVWTSGTFCNATTNASGSFTCSKAIPSGTAGGAYLFTATDAAPHSASATFTVTFVSSNPSTGVGGTLIAFSGGGFHASSQVNVTWTGGNACGGVSTAAGAFRCNFTIPTSTALGLYTFTAKDALGSTAQTSFDLLGTPALTVPAASRTSADVNQSITFNTSATGGSGHYSTYAWTESSTNLGCAFANAAKITCTPKAPGTFTVSVNVTDTNGITSAEVTSPTVQVFSDPTLSAITANRTALDEGQAVGFNVTATGGTGSYPTFTWTASGSGLGCTLVNADAIACVPSANGSYTVQVTVKDSNGISAPTVTSAHVTVSVAPSVGRPTANHATVDVGQSVTFSVTASGGAGTLTYTWHGLPTNCTSTASSFNCVPSAANASVSITVTVTDANGNAVTSLALAFTVYKDPAVPTPTLLRVKPYDVGQTVTFNGTATSVGSGSLTYTWLGLPKGCTAANASTITCPSLADGTTNVTVEVEDSNHYAVTSHALEFTVNKDPSVTAPKPSRTSADVGQALSLSVTVTGGAGSLAYLWSGLPAGCVAANASTVSCPSLTTASPYSTMVMVTDASGFTNTSTSLAFTVDSDPTISPPSATHTAVDVGQAVNFSTTASGGSGGLKFSWTGLPLGCTAGTTSQIGCSKVTTAGTYNVSANVTDSNGYVATSTVLEFTVYALPSVSLTASSTLFLQGKSVTFTATVTGGSPGKYNYSWSHLPSGCVSVNAPTLTCTPADVGTFNVTLTATDTNHGAGSATAAIQVEGSFLGLPANEGYLVLTGIILAVIAVITIFAVRWGLKRKKSRSREQLY